MNPIDEKQKRWAAKKMQPIAIEQIYSKVWPEVEIIPLDDEWNDPLKKILDPAGCDKLLKWTTGEIAFLGQRFRKYESTIAKGYDDFTLRFETKYGYSTECQKIRNAFNNNRFIATYYAYGHANVKEDDFYKFRILYFKKFLEVWAKGILKPKGPISNGDGSWFLAWSFNEIPNDCIFWTNVEEDILPPPTTLVDFMRGDPIGF